MIQAFQENTWAEFNKDKEVIESFSGQLPIQMSHSDGTALPLVVDTSLDENFGADLIRFEAGKGVGLHTHVGAHILLVTKGTGILTYGEEKYNMYPGMVYLIPSNTPHAIDAETELVLIAVGNDHQPADSSSRLDVVE